MKRAVYKLFSVW